MPFTTISWWDSRRLVQQQTILPRALPAEEVKRLQEFFQNTADGVQITMRQMGHAGAIPNWGPAPRPPRRNSAEKIRFGWYKGFTQNEVNFMAERGLLIRSSGGASKPIEKEEVKKEGEAEAEVEAEAEAEAEQEEDCPTERQIREPTDLPSETPSPPVELPLCKPPTPEKNPPDFVAERSWELRVNQDLKLERQIYTFEGLLERLGRAGGTSKV